MIYSDKVIARNERRESIAPDAGPAGLAAPLGRVRPIIRSVLPMKQPGAPPKMPTGPGSGITINAPKVPETPARAANVAEPAPAGSIITRTAAATAATAGAPNNLEASRTAVVVLLLICAVVIILGLTEDD